MPSARTALVLGASGSVGHALMHALIASGSFPAIVTFGRRSQPEQLAAARAADITLREVLVPTMDAPALERATRDAVERIDGDVVGLSVLGIGAGTAALTIDEHRAIDVALNAAFARGLAASGRSLHLALMSAVGANAAASPTGSGAAGMARYNRVKGEAEAAVLASGIPVVSIFRPAMIIGSRHTPSLLRVLLPLVSFLTPSRFRSITTDQIAAAMVATSVHPPAASAIHHYAEMMRMQGRAGATASQRAV